jgi:hypothetical protein
MEDHFFQKNQNGGQVQNGGQGNFPKRRLLDTRTAQPQSTIESLARTFWKGNWMHSKLYIVAV